MTDVVVGYLSRFGRNTAELMLNVQRLDELGATLYVGGDSPMIVTPGTRGTSQAAADVLAAVDEMQADALEDGLKAANATAIADGVSITSRTATGAATALAARSSPTTISRHGPAPADVVRRIYAMARAWRSAAVRSPATQRRARPDAERARVTSAGRATSRARAVAPQHDRQPDRRRDVSRRDPARDQVERHVGKQRKPIAWEYLPGAHVALVSDDVWKAAQLNGAPACATARPRTRCCSGSCAARRARARCVASQVAQQASRQHCGSLHAHVRLPEQGLPAARADHARARRRSSSSGCSRGTPLERESVATTSRPRARQRGAELATPSTRITHVRQPRGRHRCLTRFARATPSICNGWQTLRGAGRA
jgi:hypothetical protein